MPREDGASPSERYADYAADRKHPVLRDFAAQYPFALDGFQIDGTGLGGLGRVEGSNHLPVIGQQLIGQVLRGPFHQPAASARGHEAGGAP